MNRIHLINLQIILSGIPFVVFFFFTVNYFITVLYYILLL